ncbi:MAG: MEMO1 family protein [Candidatus Micrarchaeota archaeon]
MRKTAVAGSFYPENKNELEIVLDKYLAKAHTKYSKSETEAIGGICPHAGYMYSGETAAITYASIKNLKNAETLVMLGPNHTGCGTPVSISIQDWETPLGIAKCDVELAKRIQTNSRIIKFDESAHAYEHSIEVQIPFIQKINPKAKIVCICMMNQDYQTSREIGIALAKTLDVERHIVIASSDFSHYIPANAAEEKDKNALKYIEALDTENFQRALEKYDWSICGYGPISALMEYAKTKEIKKGKTLAYTNSGEVSGDFAAVVGYASVIFPKKIEDR